jgi:hypothetical protein
MIEASTMQEHPATIKEFNEVFKDDGTEETSVER